jgi:hypothetical protein
MKDFFNLEVLQNPLSEACVEWMGRFWWAITLFIVWTTFWKIWALWRSARNNSKIWFAFLFLLNTIGILEIIYIFGFSKKRK